MRGLAVVVLLVLACPAGADDAAARRVRVALALGCDAERDRIRRVDAALGLPCSCGDCENGCPTAPMPRMKAAPQPAVVPPPKAGAAAPAVTYWRLADGSVVAYPVGQCPTGVCPTGYAR